MNKTVYEHISTPITRIHKKQVSAAPHFHKELEIVFVKDGCCTAYTDKQIYALKSGDLLISFPYQIHYYENFLFGDYYVMVINPSVFFELKYTLNDFVPTVNKIEVKNHSHIIKLLEDIYIANGEFKNTVIAGILNQLLGLLLPEIELIPRIKTDNFTLRSILNFCVNNFTDEITLDDISNELHLNKYHISHLLSEKLGISFNSYINKLRVNMACDLLQSTDKKTTEISEEVGFGSIRSFNRAFLQITNTSPLKYRAKCKIQK